MNLRTAIGLAVALAICLGAGALGGALTGTSIDTWYPSLAKPSWNPPNLAFPIVWTTLFVAMAVAAWDVWRRPNSGPALAWFAAQLVLNVGWSAMFFGLRNPTLALVEIVVLLVVLVATARAFFRRSRFAGALLVPYVAWVGFAAVLNGAIVALN